MATRKKAPAKQAEVEEVELEELDASEGSDEAPAKKGGDEVTFGAADLARLANEKFGTKYDARTIRTLLRKMAREDKPRINREIQQGNRTRYNWSGPDDPEVVAVLDAIKGGEIEEAKQKALADLKEKSAAKKAAKKAEKEAKEAAKGKKGKKADDADEEVDLDD